MIATPLRVLVAENQYLIAMEVERLLGETLPCEVTIIPLVQLRNELATNNYDVVIVDAVIASAENSERARDILSAGAKPVFLSSFDHIATTDGNAPTYPVVSKPPQSDELTAAVLKAAHDQ